jgi:hypothetical protein
MNATSNDLLAQWLSHQKKKLIAKKYPHLSMKPATKPAPAPQPRPPSIEVEEIEDEADCRTSVPPRNPQQIMEATNGSDDDNEEDPALIVASETKLTISMIEPVGRGGSPHLWTKLEAQSCTIRGHRYRWLIPLPKGINNVLRRRRAVKKSASIKTKDKKKTCLVHLPCDWLCGMPLYNNLIPNLYLT